MCIVNVVVCIQYHGAEDLALHAFMVLIFYAHLINNNTHTHTLSGLMLPGVNAIMGPTGSGKTRFV